MRKDGSQLQINRKLRRRPLLDQIRPLGLETSPRLPFCLVHSVAKCARGFASSGAVLRQSRRKQLAGGVACCAPPQEIEIGRQHDHVANCCAAGPHQHEHHHVRHVADLQQTSRPPGFL
jgi:hypothetical protein